MLVARRSKVLLVLFLLAAAVLVPCLAQTPSSQSAEKPQLYYFVIDRSGSIRTNNLMIPIRGALVQELGRIQESAEVRLVLFNERADHRRGWPRMDMIARGELSEWFDENFVPRGDTRLYDTVGEVLAEVLQIRSAYSRIQLTILSDGIEEPPVSTRYRSWTDLEPLSQDLKRSEPPFFGTWYTLGFDPPAVPSEEAGIKTQRVPTPERGFEIAPAPPSGPPLAQVDFAVSATSGRIPLRVEFRDRSKGEIATYAWDFGDGGTSEEKNPVHVYHKAGTYTPHLAVKNTVGAESRSPGGAVIEVREPLPWWIKLSVALLAALLLWILVVVPFFLKPAMLPHKDVAVRGDSTQILRYLVSRHGWNWLWPRSYVTLGQRPGEDIRTDAATSKAAAVATFRRAFGSRTYVLKALQENAVATIHIDKDLSGNEVRDPRPLAASRTTILQDGKQYEVGGKTFTWIQPSPGRRRP